MNELQGKVAVVTGAASGIGLGLARRFAAEGMKVVMADVEKRALDEAVASLGAAAVGVPTDVRDPEQVEALARRAVDEFGAVHVVCNNAGVGAGGPIHEVSLDDWEWVLGVNLWGVIHGVRTFLPLLLAQDEGHIVNTASVAGLIAGPFLGPYNVSKFGVVAISETLNAELSIQDSNVGVSVLCPGAVRTRIMESDRNRPGGQRDAAWGPLGAGLAKQLIEQGMDPTEVAGQVVDAIRTKRLHILTHPDFTAVIRERMQRVVADG